MDLVLVLHVCFLHHLGLVWPIKMCDISFSQCRATQELLCINSFQLTALSLSTVYVDTECQCQFIKIAKVNLLITPLCPLGDRATTD